MSLWDYPTIRLQPPPKPGTPGKFAQSISPAFPLRTLQRTVIEFLMSFGAIAMSFPGHIENGTVVFDSPPPFANGTPVTVDAVVSPEHHSRTDTQSGETAEEWIARLKGWISKQPVREIEFDDSRESIYN
jgi:hypothetical protein